MFKGGSKMISLSCHQISLNSSCMNDLHLPIQQNEQLMNGQIYWYKILVNIQIQISCYQLQATQNAICCFRPSVDRNPQQ